MVDSAASNRLIAELITARNAAEQHLDDPDNSRLSGTGMIRHLADVLTKFIDEISAELDGEPAEQHQHHFPAGPVDENGNSDPADCDVDGCGLTYDEYISVITDPRL